MCGISGILYAGGKPVAAESIKAMCDVIAYRGPDDEGIYIDGNLGLGHRRLSIIDLSAQGHQPMMNEDGSITLICNGEIYNFQNMKADLESLGHVFHSKTDTEVIVHAYEQWGEECIHKFNGMFAFALWDSNRKRLFLARDRYGMKPLYYFFNGETFIFASEIKAILCNAEVKRELDFHAISEYFTFQNIYSDRTLFKNIKLLSPGHYAILSTTGYRLEISQYWDFNLTAEKPGAVSFEEASTRISELFRQAVTRQLVSDVPVGSYLSGGMDSGSIVAIASRSIPRLMTFTGGFDLSSVTGLEASFDERQAAELMASTFLTEHYEMVMHSGDMAWVLPKLIWHLEDFRLGMSYQNWYVARLASRFVKVVLAGGGGDELFAGYPWRYLSLLGCPTTIDFDKVCYRQWQRLIPDEEKSSFFTEDVFKETADYSTFDVMRSVMNPLRSRSSLSPAAALNRVLYFEAKTFLHGLLVIEDKISSAQSMETRVPFLDNDLVDFVLSLPAEYKLNMQNMKKRKTNAASPEPLLSSDGKYVLRHAMRGLIPDTVLTRKKQGFSPPEGAWYRGETMEYLKKILLAPRTLNRGYFSPAYIHKVVDEHTRGKVNHRLLIWSLLCFEWWNRVFMDRDIKKSGKDLE
jgi:asparagine synthase (glutamine-hydrolysing)